MQTTALLPRRYCVLVEPHRSGRCYRRCTGICCPSFRVNLETLNCRSSQLTERGHNSSSLFVHLWDRLFILPRTVTNPTYFDPEDGSSMFLRNVGHTVPAPRKQDHHHHHHHILTRPVTPAKHLPPRSRTKF